MIRSVAATILGFLLFGSGLTALVLYSFVTPLLSQGALWFITLFAGVVGLGAFLGLVTAGVSGSSSPRPAHALAALATLMMTVNIILNVAIEPVWFKVMVLLVTIPTLLLVDARLRARRSTQNESPDECSPIG